jgi:hypothetical protein
MVGVHSVGHSALRVEGTKQTLDGDVGSLSSRCRLNDERRSDSHRAARTGSGPPGFFGACRSVRGKFGLRRSGAYSTLVRRELAHVEGNHGA